MADKISFNLYDGNNNPVTGVSIGPAGIRFLKYVDRTGSPRTTPTIVEIGGGSYGFTPSDADELVGVCYLIDCTAAVQPRRVSGAVHKNQSPFICWHLEDAAAVLWTGADPSIAVWNDFSGTARTKPNVVDVGGFGYLFAVTPSTDDLLIDVAYRFASPVGAEPPNIAGSLDGVGASIGGPLGAAVRALLIADLGVTALVGTRIYPNELPQGVGLPAVVYTIVSDVSENSFTGDTSETGSFTHFQIDCYARAIGSVGAYSRAHSVKAAVKSVLGNLSDPAMSGTFDNARDLYDNVTQYHRVQMDFTIWS